MIDQRPLASFETDARVEDHDTVLINGRPFTVSEQPAWITRPRNTPPLFMSNEAVRLVQWAARIEADDPSGKRRLGERHLRATEFSPIEAMEFMWPDDERETRHAKWNVLKDELRAGNMLADDGYFHYRLSAVAERQAADTEACGIGIACHTHPMTSRQRAITIIGTRTRQAVERHAQINTIPAHTIDAAFVRHTVQEVCQPECSPDFVDFCDQVDASGQWRRFENAVIRETETQFGIRRGWWSAR